MTWLPRLYLPRLPRLPRLLSARRNPSSADHGFNHPDILVLGDGSATARGISAKAATLDRAASAGLSVPAGAVVIDGAPSSEVAETLARTVRGPLATRSAFSAEDGERRSLAGHFGTELLVGGSAAEIAAAIDRVRASVTDSPVVGDGIGAVRRDVLVMEMVSSTVAGVAFSEPGWAHDLVNYVEGLADKLVGGEDPGERTTLLRLASWEGRLWKPTTWRHRLARLLRDVRGEFGDQAWDVEWADDGETCWLVQVRPVTASPRRDEVFTLANHREILPDPPSVFMTSLIVENGTRLDGPLGMLGGPDRRRSFTEAFDGRPYINQSLITDVLQELGLPPRMVADALGGAVADDEGLRPLRLVAAVPTLIRLGVRQLGAVPTARRAGRALAAPDEPAASFCEVVDAAGESYVALVDQMASLATTMAPPVAVLRQLGVLADHLRTQRSAGTLMADDLEPVARRAVEVPGALEAAADGRVADDAELEALWARWMARHGHRGRYESDLASPRFTDAPETVLQSIPHLARTLAASGPERPSAEPPGSGRHWLRTASLPLWAVAAPPMRAREHMRQQAMYAFSRHRSDLVRLGEAAVQSGQLPTVDALWLLSTDEVRSLDHGTVFEVDEVQRRGAEFAAMGARPVADLRSRFSPKLVGDVSLPEDAAGRTSDRAHGLSLSPGHVVGPAWVLTSPSVELPDGFAPETTILVARSVDAGWVPTFGLVAGVAVEIGGDLSHGSIILRELGIPAITNVVGVTTRLATGERVALDASAGWIRSSQDVDRDQNSDRIEG